MEKISKEKLLSKEVSDTELMYAIDSVEIHDNKKYVESLINLAKERNLTLGKRYPISM